MAAISQNIKQDWLDMYDGFDSRQVGLGTIEPNIFATQQYQKKKQSKLLIGGLTEIVYAGMEHDRAPLILSMAHETAYNTILAYNLHYVPVQYRKAIVKFVFDSNAARIKNNEPLMIDYHALKRAIPESQYIVRRYKTVGINVLGNIPLTDWKKAIEQPSPWSNHWKQFR